MQLSIRQVTQLAHTHQFALKSHRMSETGFCSFFAQTRAWHGFEQIARVYRHRERDTMGVKMGGNFRDHDMASLLMVVSDDFFNKGHRIIFPLFQDQTKDPWACSITKRCVCLCTFQDPLPAAAASSVSNGHAQEHCLPMTVTYEVKHQLTSQPLKAKQGRHQVKKLLWCSSALNLLPPDLEDWLLQGSNLEGKSDFSNNYSIKKKAIIYHGVDSLFGLYDSTCMPYLCKNVGDIPQLKALWPLPCLICKIRTLLTRAWPSLVLKGCNSLISNQMSKNDLSVGVRKNN